jgi:GT2 family glycosyltransferase
LVNYNTGVLAYQPGTLPSIVAEIYMDQSAEQKSPYFSVIILYWNSHQTITRCLEALNSQAYRNFEILIIDNGSSDPISNGLFAQFSQLPIRLFRLEKNAGFAAGNNYAAAKARGEYLVLLNTDAFPCADWLDNIHSAANKYPDSFFASKLIMADHPERLDGIGDVYHVSGLAWRKAHNAPAVQIKDKEGEVFSACGAAAAYPAEAYHELNGFDEDYISYAEDTDLSFRLRIAGYSCIYLPNAIVYHIGSASTKPRSDLSVYLGQRNLVWTFIKDMPGMWVWVLAPLHLAMNLFMILLGVSRGQGRVVLKAKLDAVRGIPAMWKKRIQLQAKRVVPTPKLLSAMDWNLFSPIIKLFHT